MKTDEFDIKDGESLEVWGCRVADSARVLKKNIATVTSASAGVSGHIKNSASELGYHPDMEVSALEYLITCAKAEELIEALIWAKQNLSSHGIGTHRINSVLSKYSRD